MSQTFTPESGAGKTFYQVRNGAFVHEVQEGAEGAIPRVVEKGKRAGQTVYEMHENGIKAERITRVSCETKDFGGKKTREIQIDLDGDAKLKFNEKMFLQLLGEKLPLLNYHLPVSITTYKSKKGKTCLDFYQEGVKVGNAFTDWEEGEDGKWKPVLKNGIPEVTVDALGEPDFRDRDTFYKMELNKIYEIFTDVPF